MDDDRIKCLNRTQFVQNETGSFKDDILQSSPSCCYLGSVHQN